MTARHQMTQTDLLGMVARSAGSYLEVGVQEGRSLDTVLTFGRPQRVVLVDTWGTVSGGSGRDSHEHILTLLQQKLYVPDFLTFMDEDSRTALPRLSQPFDLVHIDGGHSREVAFSDMTHGWRLCRGVMVVHDIEFGDGVWPAFYEFAQHTKDCSIETYFGGHGTAVVRRA